MFDYFGQKVSFPPVYYKSMNVRAEELKRRMEPLRATLGVKSHKPPHMRVYFYRRRDRIRAWSSFRMSRN